MPTLLDAEIVADALTRLSGWSGDTKGLTRTFTLDDAQHADFLERVKVTSDAMDHHPDIGRNGRATQVTLVTHSSGGVTELDIALASRITDLARFATGQEQAPLPPEALGRRSDRSGGRSQVVAETEAQDDAAAALDATRGGQEANTLPPSL